MRLRQTVGIAAICVCLAAPAEADVNVYYHAGGWDAFGGQNEHGQPFCGVGSRNPTDGRTFSVRFEYGGSDVIFIASKTGWNIPDHTQIPVVMQVGLERPWSEPGVGSGDRVQWTLDRADYQAFDAQFRGASSMSVTFPSGNERPWIIVLNGSSAVSTAMGRCIRDMARRAGGTPAQAAPAAAPPGTTTQPFGATSAAPADANQPPPAQSEPPAQPQDQSPAPSQPTQPNAAAAPSHG